MKKILLLLPFLFFLIALLTKNNSEVKKETTIEKVKKVETKNDYANELKIIDTQEYFEKYVLDVINNGSNRLNFPSGAMEGGYVSKSDAKKIVAYMASMQGFTPSNKQWVKEGAMLFYGNCTGCHGILGKKVDKNFPDLTRKPLLGIELRKKEIYEKLKK